MLTSAAATLIAERITAAFARIGTEGDTAIATKSNTEAFAYQLLVAQRLREAADKRLKLAVKAAVAAGIIFDPEKEQRAPGTVDILYTGESVRVALSVAQPRESIDHAAWVAALLKLRPTYRKLCATLDRTHTKQSRPAHSFSTTLITG